MPNADKPARCRNAKLPTAPYAAKGVWDWFAITTTHIPGTPCTCRPSTSASSHDRSPHKLWISIWFHYILFTFTGAHFTLYFSEISLNLNLRLLEIYTPSTFTRCHSMIALFVRSGCGQMVKCGSAVMRTCSLGLGISLGLVLGTGLVLGLAHFTFCHTSSPQNPASPHARILPIARAVQLSRTN